MRLECCRMASRLTSSSEVQITLSFPIWHLTSYKPKLATYLSRWTNSLKQCASWHHIGYLFDNYLIVCKPSSCWLTIPPYGPITSGRPVSWYPICYFFLLMDVLPKKRLWAFKNVCHLFLLMAWIPKNVYKLASYWLPIPHKDGLMD